MTYLGSTHTHMHTHTYTHTERQWPALKLIKTIILLQYTTLLQFILYRAPYIHVVLLFYGRNILVVDAYNTIGHPIQFQMSDVFSQGSETRRTGIDFIFHGPLTQGKLYCVHVGDTVCCAAMPYVRLATAGGRPWALIESHCLYKPSYPRQIAQFSAALPQVLHTERNLLHHQNDACALSAPGLAWIY